MENNNHPSLKVIAFHSLADYGSLILTNQDFTFQAVRACKPPRPPIAGLLDERSLRADRQDW